MRHSDRAGLNFPRYGRRGNKRKQHGGGEEAALYKKLPSGAVTAVNYKVPTTTSLNDSTVPKKVQDYNHPTTSSSWGAETNLHDNRLLAGYLAHEFLSRGTLFGEQYDPARAEAAAVQATGKPEAEPNRGKPKKLDSKSYAEVASLLQSEGTHIPGIVNPTQLARWIQL